MLITTLPTSPNQALRAFVRVKMNCTLSLDFTDIALLRDFEELKVVMLNPIDFFSHTYELY